MLKFPLLELIMRWVNKQTKPYLYWLVAMCIPALIGGLLLKVNHTVSFVFFGVAIFIWLVGCYPIYLWEKNHKRR